MTTPVKKISAMLSEVNLANIAAQSKRQEAITMARTYTRQVGEMAIERIRTELAFFQLSGAENVAAITELRVYVPPIESAPFGATVSIGVHAVPYPRFDYRLSALAGDDAAIRLTRSVPKIVDGRVAGEAEEIDLGTVANSAEGPFIPAEDAIIEDFTLALRAFLESAKPQTAQGHSGGLY